MDLLFTFVGFIFGVIVTFIICLADRKPNKVSGRLIIDFSKIDNNFLELELCEDLDSIYTKQYITLLVDTNDFSQE